MKLFPIVIILTMLITLPGCDNDSKQTTMPYQTYEGDPLHTRVYTLDNGLKLFLTQYDQEPRVFTRIAVKTGSRNDPPETTGLAHYLEHMLFKGTDRYGTIDWEKEKPLLEQIKALYEAHRNTTDTVEKRAIYNRIDSLSQLAAQYAIPNEYDKMISSIGGSSTNAYTSTDQTVYINEIPTNELKKWLMLEAERFRNPVMRLFHTELETVYEEFNRSQDSDFSRAYKKFMKALFPEHPYGTQPTIGLGEHLKNPSIVNIEKYYQQYYVPSNMAICISGDFDPDSVFHWANTYFSVLPAREVKQPEFPPLKPIESPVEVELTGPEHEFVLLGFRFPGAASEEAEKAELIKELLYNRTAGIIDLDLVQQQKVLNAMVYFDPMRDYSSMVMYGVARKDQSLEEVRDLLLHAIERIKTGDYDDWLIEAVVRNKKLELMRSFENNRSRSGHLENIFIYDLDAGNYFSKWDRLARLTKEDIADFASAYLSGYVVLYKRQGEREDVMKVKKPPITPVEVNRDLESEFYKSFVQLESPRIEPEFIDFKKDLVNYPYHEDIPFTYVENQTNELFTLQYIWDIGTHHQKWLPHAMEYIRFLGTKNLSPKAFRQELFKLGLDVNTRVDDKRCFLTLSGLESSLEEGIRLFEDFLENMQPDSIAWNNYVGNVIKQRADDKKSKNNILYGGMLNYMRYGEDSPFRDIVPADSLKAADPQWVVGIVRALPVFFHQIHYYGQKNPEDVVTLLKQYHRLELPLSSPPPVRVYTEREYQKPVVYFTEYDMVQAEVLMTARDQLFDKELVPYGKLFNEYFGAGLSSIVFQEIRESRALAYAAYAYYYVPRHRDRYHWVGAYIGTQADKLGDAIPAMLALLNDMPEAREQFEAARESVLKKIETSRTPRRNYFSKFLEAFDLGYDEDPMKLQYQKTQTIGLEDLKNFFDRHVKGRTFAISVIGNKDHVDINTLKKLGDFQELSRETLFGY